jgi:hypothetical protein
VINAQTGTNYQIVVDDENKLVTLDNASPITLSFANHATVPIPPGGQIDFIQLGIGQVTFTGTGLQGTPGLKTRIQYSMVSAKKITTGLWVLVGDLTA